MKSKIFLTLLLGIFLLSFTSAFDWSNGTVAYYDLNSSVGNVVVDLTGNGNNGTNNGASVVTGLIENAFDFELADSDNIDYSSTVINTGSDFTASFWLNLESNSQDMMILGNGDNTNGWYFFYRGTTNTIRNTFGANQRDTSYTLNTGEWYFITVRLTSTNYTLFINNSQIYSSTVTPVTPNDNLYIGYFLPTPSLYYDGRIDEIGIWNRSLSDGEISELYNSGSGLAYGEGAVEPTVTLNSPLNNTLEAGDILFNATLNPSSNYNNTNATIYIWDQNDTIVYSETNIVTGTSINLTTFNVTNLTNGIYEWNVEGSFTNATGTFTTFAEDNLTVTRQTAREVAQIYNNFTIEGVTNNFLAQIELSNGVTIDAAVLNYNGTLNVGSIIGSGNNINVSVDILAPIVDTDTNLTFHWSLSLSNGETFNLTSKNQTINSLGIDNCTTYTNNILNLIAKDEEDQFQLSNTTLEIAINILSEDGTLNVGNLSALFENENPIQICFSENLTGTDSLMLDAIIRYTAGGYANEYYNLVDLEINSTNEPENITLYNLNSTVSTEFQLTFTGTDFLPVENALVFVERQYIAENTFKTVELPKTDANGQTILHLVRNDIIYNIRVVKDGETLGLFSNIIAFCDDFSIGNCKISLNALDTTSGIFNYDSTVGIIYEEPPEYNETTRVVSFAFSSTDGSTKIVKLTVERRDIFGNQTICTNTVVTTAGSVSCTIPSDIEDTALVSVITVDGTEWIQSRVELDTSAYGSTGYVGLFLMAIALVLIFGDSKNGVMIGLLVGTLGGSAMGWSVGGIIGLGSTGVWMIILITIALWKINKNRSN